MQEVVLAFLAGAVVGGLFTLLKLPLPAPQVFSGIMGIMGVWAGGVGAQYLIDYWGQSPPG